MMSFNQCRMTFEFVLSLAGRCSGHCLSDFLLRKKTFVCVGRKVCEIDASPEREEPRALGHLSVKSDCARGRCIRISIFPLEMGDKIIKLIIYWISGLCGGRKSDWKLMQLEREINFRYFLGRLQHKLTFDLRESAVDLINFELTVFFSPTVRGPWLLLGSHDSRDLVPLISLSPFWKARSRELKSEKPRDN